ncbi:hypothetical protein LBMAG42_55430 [Deltaproteobacteria bacterium]|nr:hypothetical protein LBMAG42_55430 [Deltaproteobacteria bacterium]
MPTLRALSLILLAPLAAGCPGPAAVIGDPDTSSVSCDRIHGATGIVMLSDEGNDWHHPDVAPSDTLSTTTVAGPMADGTWLAVENGRVYASTNGGCDWDTTGGSIPNTGDWQFVVSGAYAYAFDRAGSATANSQDGLSWASGDSSEPFLGVPAADAAIAGRLRGVQARGVVTSEDFGTTWTPSGAPPPAPPNGAAMYPGDLETAVISHSGGVAITRNGGSTWEEIGAELIEDGFVPQAIAFATTDPNTIWTAGAEGEFVMIYRTVDGGTSWNDVATSKSLDLEADAGLWPVPGKPNELLSAWASSEDNYGMNIYHIIAGDQIHTSYSGAYFHVNDIAVTEDGSWLIATDGIP